VKQAVEQALNRPIWALICAGSRKIMATPVYVNGYKQGYFEMELGAVVRTPLDSNISKLHAILSL
jgi:hypothetical protein